MADDRGRRTPTPLNNTAQIPAWGGFAAESQRVLKAYPATDETAALLSELEHYRQIFERWMALSPVDRPGPAERSPIVLEFLPVKRRALDLLVRLAAKYPAIAREVLRGGSSS